MSYGEKIEFISEWGLYLYKDLKKQPKYLLSTQVDYDLFMEKNNKNGQSHLSDSGVINIQNEGSRF